MAKEKRTPLLKRMMRSPQGHAFLSWLAATHIRFVRLTNIWRIEGTAPRDRLVEEGKGFVIALWHNRIAMTPYAFNHKNEDVTVIASGHRDGLLVVEGVGRFGIKAIILDEESPASGTRKSLKLLRDGKYVAITPDGPRGPRGRVKQGVIVTAALAGVPILPLTYAQSRRKLLRSWDKFNFPLPFATGLVMWGEPIEVPRRADPETMEKYRQHLESVLTEMTDTCDRRVGQEPIPPAPVDAPPKA